MAATWTDPVDRADGYVVGATVWNQMVGDTGNLQYLYERAVPIIKAATETVNGSATLQSDDDFLFAGAASSDYLVEIFALITTGNTPDFKFAWTKTNLTWDGKYTSVLNGVTTMLDAAAVASGAGTAVIATSAATSWPWYGMFIIHTGATATNVNFQWAQNTSDASNTSVLKNSYMRYRLLGAS